MALGTEILKWGSDWFQDTRDDNNKIAAVYSDGTYSVTLDVSIAQKVWEVDLDRGILERWEGTDIECLTAELILNSVLYKPVRGDTITITRGSKVYTYSVMAMKGWPIWEYDDHFHKALRIHTKLTGET